jgi:glycosyltransferase involved in cell wall biosynthesis
MKFKHIWIPIRFLNHLKKYGLRTTIRECARKTSEFLTDYFQLKSPYVHEKNSIEKNNFDEDFLKFYLSSLSHISKNNSQSCPMFSIIMPVWNRQEYISDAIQSVLNQTYSNWELIIVDDGSTDDSIEIVKKYLHDSRIQLITQSHQGAAAARNLALSKAKGEWIAYLDSDNCWYPYLLAQLVNAQHANTEAEVFYFAACWEDFSATQKKLFLPENLNYEAVILENENNNVCGIDLNCFVHQRNLYECHGGFDSALTRLIDFDFTYRYLRDSVSVYLPILGVHYRCHLAKNDISATESFWLNLHRIRAKHQRPEHHSLRVLYALNYSSQVCESEISAEMNYMLRQGIQLDTAHPENLAVIAKQFKPHVIHVHRLPFALKCADQLQELKIPVSVRGSSSEFTIEMIEKLQSYSFISAIYLFPHFYKSVKNKLLVKPISSCFNPRYFPATNKNRKMVLNVAEGLPTNDLAAFIRIAKSCPKHQFVLIVTRCHDHPKYVDELVKYNISLGNAVDLRIDRDPNEIETLMSEAGIYLHTHVLQSSYGMPSSISEAMASGAYVLVRYIQTFINYVGSSYQAYKNEEHAAKKIHETLNWSDQEWHQRKLSAVELAYEHFIDAHVLQPILLDWEKIYDCSAANVPSIISRCVPSKQSQFASSSGAFNASIS